ncbi:MAG: nucleotide-binding domain containing protein [Verrucomicrobiales bacterium]
MPAILSKTETFASMPSVWPVELKGRVKAGEVSSISLELIRRGGPDEVRKYLGGLPARTVCIGNAAALEDIDARAVAIRESGRRILIRSAAQIVAGLIASPPPQGAMAVLRSATPTGGAPLVVIGSFVPKTTGQLTHLLTNTDIARTELRVASLLDPGTRSNAIVEALVELHAALAARRGVVLYTSRELVTGSDAAQSLDIGNTVSAALIEIVKRLEIRPSALVTKGGITSSDVATKGLGVKRARVLGQLLPGVPVWELGSETKFPDMPYIVFPGNVGGPSALTDAVYQLTTPSR